MAQSAGHSLVIRKMPGFGLIAESLQFLKNPQECRPHGDLLRRLTEVNRGSMIAHDSVQDLLANTATLLDWRILSCQCQSLCGMDEALC